MATEIRVLPSNQLGGYGQYYVGSIYNLGLTRRPEGEFDQVTEGFANQLAEAVHRTLAPSPYIKGAHFERNEVPTAVLRNSADRLGLDAIRAEVGAEERELLLRVFFARKTAKEEQEPSRRRLSLVRILHVMKSCEDAGIPVALATLDEQLVYAPCYHSVLLDERGKTRRLDLPEDLRTCSEW